MSMCIKIGLTFVLLKSIGSKIRIYSNFGNEGCFEPMAAQCFWENFGQRKFSKGSSVFQAKSWDKNSAIPVSCWSSPGKGTSSLN